MSAPKISTSPATPRKLAAERYSPPIAEALSPGRTVREATKKSLVVRENFRPQVPISSVATVTSDDRDDARGAVHRSTSESRSAKSRSLRSARTDVAPAEQHEHRVDDDTEQQPRQRQPDEVYVGEPGREVEDQRHRADAEHQQGDDPQRQRQLLAQQRPEVDAAELGLLVDVTGAGLRCAPTGRAGDPDPLRRRVLSHRGSLA